MLEERIYNKYNGGIFLMNIKHDDVLVHLRSFGFTCDEHSSEGFLRYSKRIGDMIVTIANGQFENKIRVSLLQDASGNIRTSYKDILAYTDLIAALQDAGLTGFVEDQREAPQVKVEKSVVKNVVNTSTMDEEIGMMENPLVMFPRKPEGFML